METKINSNNSTFETRGTRNRIQQEVTGVYRGSRFSVGISRMLPLIRNNSTILYLRRITFHCFREEVSEMRYIGFDRDLPEVSGFNPFASRSRDEVHLLL